MLVIDNDYGEVHSQQNLKNQCISLTISHSLIPRMRNVSDKKSRENKNTFCVQ